MRTTLLIISIILLLAGALMPLWFLALPGLLLLSAFFPFVGVPLGFVLDLIFGVPPFVPTWAGYPFMFSSLIVGILSYTLRQYLR